MEVLLVPADVDHPAGPEVVHKTATLPGERERLLHEAEVLQTAASWGVPGLAHVVVPPSLEVAEPTLVTSAAPGPSLAAADPLAAVEVAGVAAEVARLLAGLHEAGLVHGAVEPGHVVLDGAGGAILVGLGRGGHAGAPAPGGGGEADGERLDPASDVAGWGGLVAHLLDWSATEEEPLVALRRAIGARPGRLHRYRGSRQPTRAVDDQRRALAALADQAQTPDPAHRPTARSLAAAVDHRIPGARMPGGGATTPSPAAPPAGLLDRLSPHASPAPRAEPATPTDPGGSGDPEPAPASPVGAEPASSSPRDRRSSGGGHQVGRTRPARGASPLRPGVVVAVCGLVGLGALLASARLASSRQAPVALPSPAPATSPPTRCPPVAPPAADADGDGCEETVRWAEGVLQAGSARFALGGPDDAWAVGDWDCDGRRTPALLHDGALDLFDGWPEPGGELRGRPVAAAPGARGITVVAGGDGCERPALVRPGAADLVVDPRSTP